MTAVVAGVAVTALLFAFGLAFDADTTVLVLAGLALTVDSAMRITMAPFWALERMRYEALSVGVQEGTFLALAAGALVGGTGAVGVMAAYLASRAVGLVTTWLIVAIRFRIVIVPRWRSGAFSPLLKKALPFALDDALSLAYIRLDTILLGIIVGTHAVGLYQSATNLVLYLNILPRMLNLSMYPRMSRAWPRRGRGVAPAARLVVADLWRHRDADHGRVTAARAEDLRGDVREQLRERRARLPVARADHPDADAGELARHRPHGGRSSDAADRCRGDRRGGEPRPEPRVDPTLVLLRGGRGHARDRDRALHRLRGDAQEGGRLDLPPGRDHRARPGVPPARAGRSPGSATLRWRWSWSRPAVPTSSRSTRSS